MMRRRSFKEWLVDWLYPAIERKRARLDWQRAGRPVCRVCGVAVADPTTTECAPCAAARARRTTGSMVPISKSMMMRAVHPGDLLHEYCQAQRHLTGKLPTQGGSKR